MREARIITIDHDPDAAVGAPVDVQLVGDTRATVAALRDLAEREIAGAERDRRRDAACEWVQTLKATADHVGDPGGRLGALDPRSVLSALDEGIPHPRHVGLDGGHFTTFAAGMLEWADPRELLFGLDFGSIGQSLPLCVGAACAIKDQGGTARVLVVTGDGGMMMNLQELESAVRLGVRLGVVVLNDQALGMEVHLLRLHGMSGDLARIPAPDFAELARALGARGMSVTDPGQIPDLIAALDAEDGVLVADVHIDGEIRNWRVEEMFAAAQGPR